MDIDTKIAELELSIEKTNYIINDLFSAFGVSGVPTQKDKQLYSFYCARIATYIAIANDYMMENKALIKELKELIEV